MSTMGEPGTVYTLHFDPPYNPSPEAPQYKTAGPTLGCGP